MKGLLRTIIVLALAAFLGFLIFANPNKRPEIVNAVMDRIKKEIERSSPKMEDALAAQLKDRLKQEYSYDLGDGKTLHLSQPPQLVLWTGDSSRQLHFYDYADRIPGDSTYYVPTLFRVSSQYKAFLDRIDLESFATDPQKRLLIAGLEAFRRTLGSQATGTANNPSSVTTAERQFNELLLSINKRAKTDDDRRHALALKKFSDAIVRYGRFRVYVPGSIELLHEYRLSPDLSEWSSSGPVITTTAVKGETTITSSPPVPGSTVANTDVAVEKQATVNLSFKTVRKLDIIPGGWFDAGAVQYFAHGPFLKGNTPVWGSGGEFPSMPVAIIVAADPIVRIELPDVQAVGADKAQIVKVGGIDFDRSEISVVGGDNSASLLHNSRNFYVLGVISVQMPNLR